MQKKENGKMLVDSATSQSHPDIVKLIDGRIKITYVIYDRAGNLEYGNLEHINNENKRMFCRQSIDLNHNILLPDGTMTLCCMDYGLNHPLGNLCDSSYELILKSDNIKQIKKKMREGKTDSLICKSCANAVEY